MNRMMTALQMERSKYDVQHFYEWLGYRWGPHIGDWLSLYGDRQGAHVHRVCVIAPRDHSKSTTLRVKLLHQLLFERWRNKPFTIWLFSANKDLAANRLEEIQQDLRQHPELSRMINEKDTSKFRLVLTNGAWIKATSVGSGIRGEHPAAIALDDILDDQNDMSYEAYQTWFRKKMTPMLSPGTSIYCVGTPMSMNDLYHTEMLNNEAWKTWREGAITNYDEWMADQEGVEADVLWPSERPLDYLLEQRQSIGSLAFAQEYLCKVVDDDSAVFPSTLTRKNLDLSAKFEHLRLHDGKYVIGFDPSHGIGQDFSVMIVMRKAEDGNLHLVNIWRRNDFPPDRQIDQVIEFDDAYGRPTFAFESAGFQHLYASILRQRGASLDVKQSRVSNRTLKQGLLTRLRSWFEQGRIVFPYGDDSTRRDMNILLQELEGHAWSSGVIVDKAAHNDTVMALAHAVDQFARAQKTSGLPAAGAAVDMGKWGSDEKKAKTSRVQRGATSSSRYRAMW